MNRTEMLRRQDRHTWEGHRTTRGNMWVCVTLTCVAGQMVAPFAKLGMQEEVLGWLFFERRGEQSLV